MPLARTRVPVVSPFVAGCRRSPVTTRLVPGCRTRDRHPESAATRQRPCLRWRTRRTANLALPKQGGLHTYTWRNLGNKTGPLLGVEVQFVRNNSFFPPPKNVFCT